MAKEDRGGGGPVGGVSAKGSQMDKGYADNKRGSDRDRARDRSSDRDRDRDAALDLSYCLEVAATEPDISQLMEDLEATKTDEIKYRQAAAR